MKLIVIIETNLLGSYGCHLCSVPSSHGNIAYLMNVGGSAHILENDGGNLRNGCGWRDFPATDPSILPGRGGAHGVGSPMDKGQDVYYPLQAIRKLSAL